MYHLVADPQFDPHLVSTHNVAGETLEPGILKEVVSAPTIIAKPH